MKKLIAFSFTAIALFTGVDCKDEPVQPPDNSDTTSHNFTWQTFTWGGGGASSINDVAIINDTNIWAVGEIQLLEYDSLGQRDYRPYCIVHWNGSKWNLIRIRYFPPGSVGDSLSVKANAIFARNDHDIWIAADVMFHFDGVQWTPHFNTGAEGSTKIWGDNSGKLWCVGRNGSITYYNGSSWQKVESGSTLDLHDINGSIDNKTGENQILAVGSKNMPFDRVILLIQGTSVTKLSSTPIEYELFGLWFVPNQHYYVVGDGIFEKNSLNESVWKNKPRDFTPFTTTAATGNNKNDVFIVGAFGECLHWNGASWHSYRSVTALNDGYLGTVAVKENTLIIGGQTGQHAIVMMGKR